MKTAQLGDASMLQHAVSARRASLNCEIIRIDHHGTPGDVAISANNAIGRCNEVGIPARDAKRLNEASKFTKSVAVEQSGDPFTSGLTILSAPLGDGLWSTRIQYPVSRFLNVLQKIA
jgi:hypothetical protein